MVLRTLVIASTIVVAVVLQTALFPSLAIAGFRPDLLLLVTVAWALRDGPSAGVRVGFAAGLVADLLLHESTAGLTVLVLLGVGYAVGQARPYFALSSVTAPLLLASVSGVVATAGYGVLSRLLGDERYTVELVLQASLYVAAYNTLLAPVVLGIVTRLAERFPLEPALSA